MRAFARFVERGKVATAPVRWGPLLPVQPIRRCRPDRAGLAPAFVAGSRRDQSARKDHEEAHCRTVGVALMLLPRLSGNRARRVIERGKPEMHLPLGPLLVLLMLRGPASAQSPPRPVDQPASTAGNPTRDDAATPDVARPARPPSEPDSKAAREGGARGERVASLRHALALDQGWLGELWDFLAERDWIALLLVLFNFLLAL